MKIAFTGEYKSLKSFESDELSGLSIITGKNGCGKSQLIELIKGKDHGSLLPQLSLEYTPEITKIQIEGMVIDSLSNMNSDNWKMRIDTLFHDYYSMRKSSIALCDLLVQNNMWLNDLLDDTRLSTINNKSKEEVEQLIEAALKEIDITYFTKTSEPTFQMLCSRFVAKSHSLLEKRNTILAVREIANYNKKLITDLQPGDFYNTPISSDFLNEPRLFGSHLESVFYNYAKRRDQNQRLYFSKNTYGDENESISDDEFISKYQAPWDMINQILSESNLDFKLRTIDRKEFTDLQHFALLISKLSTGIQYEFKYLSSGEKVILGLIIKLFTTSYYKDKLEFPELIVLDEPDAYLHPEMSKLLIDVLQKIFVEKLGIKVIMITHSPSTVALSPDDSIYKLTNYPETSLKKIKKSDALKFLTDFIPTLSIDYENHKQVFVESHTDINYYQIIFNKLNEERNYPFNLYFIANSSGKGNCDQVGKIVNNLRLSGSTTVYGIIDWDLKNKETDYVKVHGLNKRYSVENYLYDPIYICILLMNLNAYNIFKELEIDETTNQYLIGNKSEEFLQKIIEWFLAKYYKVYNHTEKDKNDFESIEYMNDKKISLPKWLLNTKGHDFEKRIKEVFPVLGTKYANEGSLQKEISIIIGKCYPFIPKDSESLIQEIMNG